MIAKFLKAAVVALLIAGPVHAQVSPDVLAAYNSWVARAIPPFYYMDDPADRAKLAEANRVADVNRVTTLYNEANSAAWLAQFPQEKAAIMQSLQQAAQLMQVTAPTPYPAQLGAVLQNLANQMNTVHTRLVQANGGQEVLNAQNLAAVTPTTPAPGTNPGTNPGTTPPANPGDRPTPGAGPGSLLGVGSENGPGGPGGTTVPSTGTTTTATAPATTNTTASAASTGTATTAGATNRGAAKQGLTTAEQMIRTQLADANLMAGAILGPDGATLQAAKDSLADIASYVNRPPLSTNYASDVQAIVGPLQSIATANFGPQGFQAGNQRIAQAREQILAAIATLSGKLDASQ